MAVESLCRQLQRTFWAAVGGVVADAISTVADGGPYSFSPCWLRARNRQAHVVIFSTVISSAFR